MRNKSQFKLFKTLILMTIALAVVNMPITFLNAASTNELNNLKNQLNQTTQQKTTKQTQAAELANQVAIADRQIGQTQASLSETQNQINRTQKTIADLDKQILDEQSNLDREQEKMSQLIASWYMEGNSGLMEAMISANNISDLMDKQQYYESLRQQIQLNTERIQSIKTDLANQKNEQSSQLQISNGLKQDQLSQQNDLESKKSFKNQLLNNTASTITSLQKQEADLKGKIDAMAAQLAAAYSGGVRMQGGDVMPSIDPSWYQTQLGNYTRLGDTPYPNVNINNYGCYITSIAMMASYYGHRITNTDIATRVGNFSNDGYLNGFNPPGIGVTLGSLQRVDWGAINNELDNGHPVIAGVLLDSFKGRSHPNYVSGIGFDHFIVIKSRSGNKYYMHDPAQGRGYRSSDVVAFKIVRP